MRIAALHTYPVKGCHRIDHDVARVEPRGLAGDRRWMMVDADGVGITQRETPVLTRLRVRERAGGLVLAAPGLPTLDVDEPSGGPPVVVRVFSSQPPASALVAESEWSSAFLGRPARLVWQVEPREPWGAPVSFADGSQVLLANEASLAALNDWLLEAGDEPVPMTRFRPNLVVTGAPPWAEDGWSERGARLRIGDVLLRAGEPCARCLVTTIDQETGEKGKQPLRALGRYRNVDQKLLFAINVVPGAVAGGSLRVGDPVTVLD